METPNRAYGWVHELVEVVKVLVAAGERQRAAEVAGEAERVARSTPPGDEWDEWQARSAVQWTVRVAEVLADVGEYQRSAEVAGEAEQRARFKTGPREQADALAVVAGALAEAGQRDEAEQVARSLTDPRQQAQALVAEAEGLVEAGQQGAVEVARKAARVARSIDDRDVQLRALNVVVKGLARAEQPRRAARVIRSFPKKYRNGKKYRDPLETEQAAREVMSARARAGQPWRARWAAHRYGVYDVSCMAAMAEGLFEAGQQQRAAHVARKAAEDDLNLRYGPPDKQVTDLAAAARALALVGQQQRAAQLAGEAEQVARSIVPRRSF